MHLRRIGAFHQERDHSTDIRHLQPRRGIAQFGASTGYNVERVEDSSGSGLSV